MTGPINNARLSPWPHRLAVLLVCATFPLLWVGGLVTTTKAGMAVPDWPNTFGYNLFLYPWTTWLFGPWNVFVEHGHRLFATLIGMLTIALVVSVWRAERRAWVRWLTVAALLGVIGQGVLGGVRVLLNEQTFAMIHGCVGPAFFALTVALAVFTSQRWRSLAVAREDVHAGSLHRLAFTTTVFAYTQLVLGAFVRHMPVDARPGTFRAAVLIHLVMAGIVALHAALLAWVALRRYRDDSAITRPAVALAALVMLQIGLGAWTWVVKYNWPSWTPDFAWTAETVADPQGWLAAMVTTAHVATGSLILAVSLLTALRSARLLRMPRRVELPLISKKMEGAR